MLKDAATENLCQLPGCTNPVEQPQGGGPRKRFCSDQHRVQFWRQSRSERNQAEKVSAADEPAGSHALALRSQLEQSVQHLENVLTRTRTTLIELSDLEEAEAIRNEAFSSAEEHVARAHAKQVAEERRRLTAENLAEAAGSAAREAEEKMNQALAESEARQLQLQQARQELEELQKRAEAEAAAIREEARQAVRDAQVASAEQLERAQERLERANADLRTEIESRTKAEMRAQAAEERIKELQGQDSARSRDEFTEPASAKLRKTSAKGKKPRTS